MEQHSHLKNDRTQVSTDSADSVLPLSILMEVRVLEHGTSSIVDCTLVWGRYYIQYATVLFAIYFSNNHNQSNDGYLVQFSNFPHKELCLGPLDKQPYVNKCYLSLAIVYSIVFFFKP